MAQQTVRGRSKEQQPSAAMPSNNNPASMQSQQQRSDQPSSATVIVHQQMLAEEDENPKQSIKKVLGVHSTEEVTAIATGRSIQIQTRARAATQKPLVSNASPMERQPIEQKPMAQQPDSSRGNVSSSAAVSKLRSNAVGEYLKGKSVMMDELNHSIGTHPFQLLVHGKHQQEGWIHSHKRKV